MDHIGDANRNGVRDIYVGARMEEGKVFDKAPSRNIDQLVLLRKTELGDKLLDAVAWTLPGRRPEQFEADDYNMLVEKGIWTGSSLEVTSIEGASWTLRDITAPSGAEAWALSPVSTGGMSTDAANIPSVGMLKLTEVHPMADRREAFAEIHCEKSAPAEGINIRAFVLTNLAGEASPLADRDLTLKPGEYAIVHWGIEGKTENDNLGDLNKSGYRDIFLPAGEASARTQDVLALALGGQVFDAISWKQQDHPLKDDFSRTLDILRARGVTLTPMDLAGPETLLGRAVGNWFVTSIPSPGGSSRLVSAPDKGTVIISEVYPDGASSWAELEVTGKAPADGIDISLFVVSDMDGRGAALSNDPVTLKPGERVIVRWSEGADESDGLGDLNGNGMRDIYLGASNPPAGTIDQLSLQLGVRIYDAIAWRLPEAEITKAEQADLDDLTSAGFRGHLAMRHENGSVGRLEGKCRAFADPTPGLPNNHYLARSFGAVRISAFQISHASAWVEIEATRGSTDISRLIITDLDERDAALSERNITLKKGERARITWGKGTSETDEVGDANKNGIRDIMLDQDPPTKSADEIVLIHDGRMLDAVVFSDWKNAKFPHPEQKDVKTLVDRKLWRADDFSNPSSIATSGRVRKRAGTKWVEG